MTNEMIDASIQVTRRTIMRRGAKLLYAIPLIIATVKLTTDRVDAISAAQTESKPKYRSA